MNRIAIILPLYRQVSSEFFLAWVHFQGELARYEHYAGLTVRDSIFVHQSRNEMIELSLHNPNWDYLLCIDSDQVLPKGLMERVGTYEEPIVGAMYFGRHQWDQRAVPGMINSETGMLERFSMARARELLAEPGLHPVDVVGMGCTAIRRDVFEGWRKDLWPWFQAPYNGPCLVGEDIWFCQAAYEQGWQTYVDTAMVAGHIGTWTSDEKTASGGIQLPPDALQLVRTG